jgi:tRNA nucleotidyltransferase (CCA-adding enzyme)
VAELERLRDSQTQLQMQGILPDAATANFPLLTAKMAPKEIAALKKSFARHGFVVEIEALEKEGKEFAAKLSGKEAALPSQAWKLLYAAKPEAVLWVAHTSKNAAILAKFKGFYTEWAQARLKLPHTLMQEMRIVPDLPGYDALLEKLFFELMDNKLGTVEEMKAYLEPYSPPAPPPPVHLRRPRVPKKDAKPAKSRKKAAVAEGVEGAAVEGEAALAPVAAKPVKSAAPAKTAAPVKVAAKKAPVKAAAPVKKAAPVKAAPVKKAVAKKPVAKKVVAKAPAKKAAPAKAVGKKAPAKKVVAKKPVKKAAPSKAPAKKAVAKKPVAKKAAGKSVAKKR